MTTSIAAWVGSLNQHPLAFEQNLTNILDSLSFCQDNGCVYRPGIELEVTGFSCGEHFKEKETTDQAWESVATILASGLTKGLLVEIGMPFVHEENLYNCLVVIYDGKVLYIRPKTELSTTNLYDEKKYFTAFGSTQLTEEVDLPKSIQEVTGQTKVGFGRYFARLNNFSIIQVFRSELERHITKQAMKIDASVISVPNAGFFETGTFAAFAKTIRNLSRATSSHVLINSIKGTEGSKLLFEGGALWAFGGNLKTIHEPLGLIQVESARVIMPLIPQLIKSYLGPTNFRSHKSDIKLTEVEEEINFEEYSDFSAQDRERELLNAMSCYIWDQLIKSGACGFFVPLSGGADSSLISFTVYYLCHRIYTINHPIIARQLRACVGEMFLPFDSPAQLTGKILFTAYLPSSFSGVTRKNAEGLATRIGSNFMEIGIQKIFDQFRETIEGALDIKTSFRKGDQFIREDLALQNIQARTRLVLSYLCAQLLPVKFNLKSFLLCFGTGNLSEVFRGYYTKYDCSSGDLNIIGSLSKTDIKSILQYAAEHFDDFEILKTIATQPPTAELRPSENNHHSTQTDEEEMGFTYEELDFLGTEMKVSQSGPKELAEAFNKQFPNQNAEEKVEKFLVHFRRNRHKATVLPASVHLTNYDIDGAFDSRPVLYL
jgi:NAD+ synthase (glutamine-hydrolysing)